MKTHSKRLLSILLSVAMILSLLVIPAAAETEEMPMGEEATYVEAAPVKVAAPARLSAGEGGTDAGGDAGADTPSSITYAWCAKNHNGAAATQTNTDVTGIEGVVFSDGFALADGHGALNASGGTLTVTVPEGKFAKLILTACAYGKGYTQTAAVTAKVGTADAVDLEHTETGNEKDPTFQVMNAQGTVVFTFPGKVYVHALTMELSDTAVKIPEIGTASAEWDFKTAQSALKDPADDAETGAKYASGDVIPSDRFDCLTLNNVKYHGTSYGTSMGNGASIGITVPGDCNIEVTVGHEWNLKVGEEVLASAGSGKATTTVTFHYKGAAGSTATLQAAGTSYVAKIKLVEYSTPPKLALEPTGGVIVKKGETVDVTAGVENATLGTVTATPKDTTIATAAVDGGKITITGAEVGKTEVDVSATYTAPVDGTSTAPVTGTIPVRVAAAEIGEVAENTTYTVSWNGTEGIKTTQDLAEDTFYSASGLEWKGLALNNGHGPNGTGSVVVHIPQGKQTDLTFTTCCYGDGGEATASAGTLSAAVDSDEDNKGVKGKTYTLTGASGNVEISFSSKVYVHQIKVGAFTDATKPFEAKKWEFANDTFDPATTYEDLTITGGTATGAAHGMAFFGEGSIVLPVNGPCNIKVTGSHAWDINLDGSKLEAEKTPSEGQAATELTFYYTGNAGTVTLNCGARTWIKSIELAEATEAPAKLAVEKTSVSLKLGSSITSKTDVAVYLRNAQAADVAVSVDKEDVATATYANGKVTLQGKAEGEATVTLKLKGEAAATITVAVAGAGDQTVAEGEYILTDTSNPNRLTVPGIDFGSFVIISNNHGAINQGEAVLTFNLARAADIQIMTCPFGTGQFLDVKASSGKVTMEKINSCGATDTDHYQNQEDVLGAKINIVGAQKGKLTVTLTPTEGGAGNFDFDLGSGIGKLNPDQIWMKNVSVTYYADLSGDRNIDVWDLAGLAYGEEEFKFAKDAERLTDNITPEIWVDSKALGTAQFAGAAADSFGDLVLTHNANDRIYSSVEGNADFITLLGANAAASFNQEFPDGFKSAGGYYANGTGSAANRCVTFNRVAAGDKIIAYVGSAQNGDVTIHFQGQGGAAGQEDTQVAEVKTYHRMEFVAEKEGNYKLWGGQPGGGKPFYIRFIRVPAVAVSGAIELPKEFNATDYKVKFTNKTTKKTTFGTVNADGTFTASLAAGYEYTAMLTGAPGWGFTVDTKNVAVTNEESLTGKANVTLKVEPKETYTFSGNITGFAAGYDSSKLAITMIPEEGSGSDEVVVEIKDLAFSAKLDPGVVYTPEYSGVNDYVLKTPESVMSEKDDVTQNIVMEAKPLYTASGKFLGLGADGKVTALVFENVEDKYTYEATVTADGYTAKLRDGAYASKVTVEGKYSTLTHVVVDGKDVTKDLLFVSGAEKPAVDKVKDVYVGYPAKSPNFETMTEAVDAISRMGIASEEDRVTVHIAPGTYREQLTIKTPYVTFINEEPAKGEVLLTWYYGIGYKYYSSNGYYDAQRAYDKFEKKIADRWGCAVRVIGEGFRAENITFENSFNRYITEEEIADGVEVAGNEAINVVRNYSADVEAQASQERATAICIEANKCEFFNCQFLSSQDTLYTQGTVYFKNCLMEGTTDYIFGDTASKCIFDGCELSFKGYSGADGKASCLTALRTDEGQVGYLFRNCAITAAASNPKMIVPTGNSLGRPWSAKANVFYLNTKMEDASLILDAGWTQMNNDKPENAQFAEFGTTLMDGTAVDTSKRVTGTVKTEAEAKAINDITKFFGSWVPFYYVEEAATVAFEKDPFLTDNGDINTPYPGHTLTVNYSLGAANDANDASMIKWFRVAADGTETLLKTTTAAVSKSYQLTKADIGAKIKVEVTPTTISGNTAAAKSVTLVESVRDGFEDPDGKLDPELGDGVNVFLAGDSTVTNYAGRDEGSWGEMLQHYFNKDLVTVVNHAVGGRSTRNFINEGKLDAIAQAIGEGDFLFIQFGHNDCANEDAYRIDRYAPLGEPDASGKYPSTPGVKNDEGKYTWDCGGTYKWYLQQYIDVAKKAGATPVLVTPVARLYYDGEGNIRPHHDASLVPGTEEGEKTKNPNMSNTYCEAVKQLAEENGIVCIDGFAITKKLYEDAYKACNETTKDAYGRQVMHEADSTHSNKLGGMIQAAAMASAIQDLDLSISKAVRAPKMAMGVTTKGKTVFTVDSQGKFTAYNMLSKPEAYTAEATYWMGIGQKLFDALKAAQPDDPTTPVNKDELTAAVAEAKKAAKGIYVVADDVTAADVNRGTEFITKTDKKTLDDAIAAAEAVLADANATETQLAKAKADLDKALKAIQTGTKSTGSHRPSGGTTTSTTRPTTTVVKDANGNTAKKTTNSKGDVEIVVTDKNGEVLAEIKLPASITAAQTKFKDVPDNHWAAKSIHNMAGLGMVKGVSEDTYDMNSPMTRGAIATVLFRLANGKVGKTTSFADVAADAWYTDAVGWAVASGVVTGYSETAFGPDDTITRQQLAVMITRLLKLAGVDTAAKTDKLGTFVDGAATSDWAKDSVAWCVENGIMKGKGSDILDPLAAISRAEAATMLDRAVEALR